MKPTPPKEQIGKGKGWLVVDVGKGANCQPSHSIGCTTNQFLVKQKACKGKTFDQGYNWQWEFPPPCHVSRLMEEDICVTNIQIDGNGCMCYKYRQRSTRGELFRGANHNHMRDASMQPANIGMKKKFLQITYQK